MLFQLKKLPEIINFTRFLKSFWILYIDQIIVYNTFYSNQDRLSLDNIWLRSNDLFVRFMYCAFVRLHFPHSSFVYSFRVSCIFHIVHVKHSFVHFVCLHLVRIVNLYDPGSVP
jgi:hypothetical protein